MCPISKPMLATKCSDISKLNFPVLVTPKLDGIRCVIINGKALSRKFKEIPNRHIFKLLSALPDGLDGELMLNGQNVTFQQVTSAIMSENGEPDFSYNVFDYVSGDLMTPYNVRMMQLRDLTLPKFVDKILPTSAGDEKQLVALEEKFLAEGFEGAMVRSYRGPYKCGRSTEKEGYLLKVKRFTDAEAVVVGFEERMHNENEATKDELGHTKRSSGKEGLVPAGTLGALVVKDAKSGVQFKIGTGFDDAQRKEIWGNRNKYLTELVKYKHQEVGQKDLPRFPVFLGFRDRRDI